MKIHIKLSQKALRKRYFTQSLRIAKKTGFCISNFYYPEHCSSLYLKNGKVKKVLKKRKPTSFERLLEAKQYFMNIIEEESNR